MRIFIFRNIRKAKQRGQGKLNLSVRLLIKIKHHICDWVVRNQNISRTPNRLGVYFLLDKYNDLLNLGIVDGWFLVCLKFQKKISFGLFREDASVIIEFTLV